MRTLRVPFQIDSGGGLSEVSDTQTIVEQQMIDVLMTNFGERIMRPRYGANLRGFLFSPTRQDFMALKSGEAQDLLRAVVTLADIVNVRMIDVVGNDSTVKLQVYYRIKPSQQLLLLDHTIDGLVTQETQFA